MACAHKLNTNCSELLPMYTYTIIFFCILIVCLFVVWVGPWVLQDAFIVVHLRVFDKYLRRWSRLASGSPLRVARQPDMLTWPPAASPSAKYETIWKYSIFYQKRNMLTRGRTIQFLSKKKNRLRIRGVSPLLLLITCEFFPPKWLKMSFESKGLKVGQGGLKEAIKSQTWTNQGWKW